MGWLRCSDVLKKHVLDGLELDVDAGRGSAGGDGGDGGCAGTAGLGA